MTAVELSALREHELPALVEAVPTLDLRRFDYVSFHVPSKLQNLSERAVVDLLGRLPKHWPLIVHPEIIEDASLWEGFGRQLCLENMDDRKPAGRTVEELRRLFLRFPRASFCLDAGHAKQVDPTMTGAFLMLREFVPRLRQVHVSDVGSAGEHLPIGVMARVAFGRISDHIPSDCPLIIESVLPDESCMRAELQAVRNAFEHPTSMKALAERDWAACSVVL